MQLVSLCRFVGIQPFGTDAFLRSRLRRHLVEIKVGRVVTVFLPRIDTAVWQPVQKDELQFLSSRF